MSKTKNTDDRISELADNIKELTKSVDTIAIQTAKNTSHIQVLIEGQAELRDGQNSMRADITELRDGQNSMRADITELRDGQNSMRADITEIRGDITELRDGQNSMRADITELRDGQETMHKSLILLENNTTAILTILREGHGPLLKEHDVKIKDCEKRIRKLEGV